MQSSLIVALRALLLVVSLIVIGVVAILTTSLSDRFALSVFKGDEPPAKTAPASATVGSASATTAPKTPEPKEPAPWRMDEALAEPLIRSEAARARISSSAVPAFWSPGEGDDPRQSILRTSHQSSPQDKTGASLSAESTLADSLADRRDSGLAHGETAGEAPVGLAADVDPLAALGRRFQELGAVYYRLESWGGDPPRRRFRCEMPLDAGRRVRFFETHDPSPLRAMERVLREVESWLQRSAPSR